ncbi:MAG: tetratricopeptide repeat protein [Fibrobacteres bacterium]|nr:tetratricopeptide repeat protein [Fibrobacterota bacterium]
MIHLPSLVLLWIAQSQAIPTAPAAASGLSLYMSGKFEQALDAYERTLAKDKTDSAALIGRVRSLGRLGRYDEAMVGVRAILKRNPRDGIAATVYSDLFQPNRWTGYANADSCWAWATKAVTLSPHWTEAWLSYWIEATMRGEDDRADVAIRKLARLGMWSRTTLALDSFILASAPKNAVLILNGDADLLGMRQLQVVDGVRTDVHLEGNMLQAQRYWHNRIRKGLLPAPADSAEIDRLFDSAPDSLPAATDFVAKLNTTGKWPVVALFKNTSRKNWNGFIRNGRDLGVYWLMDGSKESASIEELRKMKASIMALNPRDFSGPSASVVDESPIRRNSGSLVYAVGGWVADIGVQLAQQGEIADFEKLGNWIAPFLRKARPDDPETIDQVQALTAWQEKIRSAIAEAKKER